MKLSRLPEVGVAIMGVHGIAGLFWADNRFIVLVLLVAVIALLELTSIFAAGLVVVSKSFRSLK